MNAVGIVKTIHGIATATSPSGEIRTLKVGDTIYAGEIVANESIDGVITLSMENGEDIILKGKDILTLDQSIINLESFGNETQIASDSLSKAQKAIMDGKLEDLEETAAGEEDMLASASNFGDGAFLANGSESNIFAGSNSDDKFNMDLGDFGRNRDDAPFKESQIQPGVNVLAPEVIINDGGDGVINQKEADAGVPVTIKFEKPLGDGESVKVEVNGKEYPVATNKGDKEVTFIIPKDSIPTDGSDIDITAKVQASNGDTTPEGSDTAKTDLDTPNTSTTNISINDITNDNLINAKESKKDILVSGKVSGEFEVGDKVIAEVNGVEYETTVSDKEGNFSIDVKGSDLAADDKIKATVTATDKAGNEDEVSTQKNYTVDIQAPNASIRIENIAEDDILSATEAQGKVKVVGSVSGDVKDGDEVILIIGGKKYPVKGIVQNGKFEVEIEGKDLIDVSNTIKAKVTIIDEAGNSTTVEDLRSYEIDTDIPNYGNAPKVTITEDVNNDGFINAKEMSKDNKIDIKVSFDKNKVEIGDIVKIIDNTDPTNPIEQNILIDQTAKDKGNQLQHKIYKNL